MSNQHNKNYVIVSFFTLSTITLFAIQSYAVYQFSITYLLVAPMLAFPFAIAAGLIPDSTVWLSHLLDLGKKSRRGIQGAGFVISVLIGLLFSYMVVGQSANWIVSMLFFSSFQLVGILLQFITSKPSLEFVFGHHDNHELKQLDKLHKLSNQLATRFNRGDELNSVLDTLDRLEGQHVSLAKMITSLATTTPDQQPTTKAIEGDNAIRLPVPIKQPVEGMNEAEIIAWMQANAWIVTIATASKLYDVLGISRDKYNDYKIAAGIKERV